MRPVLVPCVFAIAAAVSPPAFGSSTGIVIAEFRTRGPNGGNDEFIELYNLSAATVDVGGWKVRGSSNAGAIGTRATILAGTVINPGCRYLLTNSASGGYGGGVPGDQTYSIGISDDGGVGITLPDDTVVDQVGMSAGSAFKEGTPLAPLTLNADQGYERAPGGSLGNSTDTDDNNADFALVAPSKPQNAAAACHAATPTATETATSAPTETATRTPTPTSTHTPSETPTTIPTDTATAPRTLTTPPTATATTTTTASATGTLTPTLAVTATHTGAATPSATVTPSPPWTSTRTFTPPPPPATDMDADGVEDAADNCPGDFNPAQSDADGEGTGDACDASAPAALVLREVTLRASQPRRLGTIRIRGRLAAGISRAGLASSLRLGGLRIGLTGVGLDAVEVLLFPGVRCVDLRRPECVGEGGELVRFRPRPGLGRDVFDVHVAVRGRSLPFRLQATGVSVVLSVGGQDHRARLERCAMARNGRLVRCEP
jgi:hypothetical protein